MASEPTWGELSYAEQHRLRDAAWTRAAIDEELVPAALEEAARQRRRAALLVWLGVPVMTAVVVGLLVLTIGADGVRGLLTMTAFTLVLSSFFLGSAGLYASRRWADIEHDLRRGAGVADDGARRGRRLSGALLAIAFGTMLWWLVALVPGALLVLAVSVGLIGEVPAVVRVGITVVGLGACIVVAYRHLDRRCCGAAGGGGVGGDRRG